MKRFLFFVFFGGLCYAHPFIPYERNHPFTEKHHLTITTVFKNEAEWLKEWIEFHRLVGVDHFHLYNNESEDDYLEVLLPYIEAGIVELFDCKTTDFFQKTQHAAFNNSIRVGRGKTKWLAIIDSDEFLTPIDCEDLRELLELYEDYPGVTLKWRVFGTSHVYEIEPGELMIEKLVQRARDSHQINQFVKSIVKPDLTNGVCNSHHCSYKNGLKATCAPVSEARINHYLTRTEKFLNEVKIPRVENQKTNAFKVKGSLKKFIPASNAVDDNSMERFVEPLREIVYQ